MLRNDLIQARQGAVRPNALTAPRGFKMDQVQTPADVSRGWRRALSDNPALERDTRSVKCADFDSFKSHGRGKARQREGVHLMMHAPLDSATEKNPHSATKRPSTARLTGELLSNSLMKASSIRKKVSSQKLPERSQALARDS